VCLLAELSKRAGVSASLSRIDTSGIGSSSIDLLGGFRDDAGVPGPALCPRAPAGVAHWVFFAPAACGDGTAAEKPVGGTLGWTGEDLLPSTGPKRSLKADGVAEIGIGPGRWTEVASRRTEEWWNVSLRAVGEAS